jgi:hypothetical protein
LLLYALADPAEHLFRDTIQCLERVEELVQAFRVSEILEHHRQVEVGRRSHGEPPERARLESQAQTAARCATAPPVASVVVRAQELLSAKEGACVRVAAGAAWWAAGSTGWSASWSVSDGESHFSEVSRISNEFY